MTITLTREEAKQVLAVLEYPGLSWADSRKKVAEILRARLAQPEPEPVAVWELQEGGWDTIADRDWMESLPIGTKLYTASPQREEGCAECGKKSSDGWALYCVKCSEREWQGLTDEEIRKLSDECAVVRDETEFIRAIEAKLKEKNS